MNLDTAHDRIDARNKIVSRDGQTCHVCGGVVNLTLPPSHDYGPTIDHVLPVKNGGSDDLPNLKLAHKTCNDQRGHVTSATADSSSLRGLAQIGSLHGWGCLHCNRTCDPAVTERSIIAVRQRNKGMWMLMNLRLAHVECESVAHPPAEMIDTHPLVNKPSLWHKRLRGHIRARTDGYRRRR